MPGLRGGDGLPLRQEIIARSGDDGHALGAARSSPNASRVNAPAEAPTAHAVRTKIPAVSASAEAPASPVRA
ncbi:hypothetical protein GCM10011354_08260 [Egicoccus halophilus]|uniref:Uncharacterized protein n=1 Tax=Egicoccus halophilus TaxID=1670830 RepID=A0A8J3ER63_9ACTN|nr:hypothetical protein GCM10011354_08260 [Egicoccus halophilus]